MSNMFSGKTEKHIPKTLTECTRIDPTVSNLHIWTERLEAFGKALFFILIAIGIISTIAEGITVHEYLNEMKKYVNYEELLAEAGMEMPSVLDVVISSIIKWGLLAYLEYCAYHALALIISALASITQHTIISANIALYDAYQKQSISTPNTPTSSATTPPASHNRINRPLTSSPEMWICKSCNTQNKIEYGQCKKCGKFRTSD